ncbi:putative uncharacterized protein DDB_G0272194 isoform X2 [Drosophila innubila]|uniref:putative uncharacterized protein DDB_G0272194 isoform X2 n=1 Tax=Drosophila innubila TaxID=198719 RepID=UPI00148BB167|nr:putative uncharacterized protein DDB_G0272194 isoform X2 [Drosophila innubila]
MPRNLGSGSRLVDLGAVCLICLRAEQGYCSIYGQDLETPHMQIVDKIRSCSALQLDRPLLAQLPDKICHGCRNELSITYRFQQKCLEAQKVFQSAATATLLLDVDKLQLEQQQQLKLPASLRIKRLETEPASSRLKYYNDDVGDGDTLTLVKKEDAVTTIVLQDLTGVASDNDDDKMIALGVDWGTDAIESESSNVQDLEQNLEQELDLEQKLEEEEEEEEVDEQYKLSDEQPEEVQTMPCVTVTSSNSSNNNISNTSSNNNISSNNINSSNINSSNIICNMMTTTTLQMWMMMMIMMMTVSVLVSVSVLALASPPLAKWAGNRPTKYWRNAL